MSQPIEIHTLAGAYALDALTEIERAGFARHLAECSVCATEVAELRRDRGPARRRRLGVAAAAVAGPGLPRSRRPGRSPRTADPSGPSAARTWPAGAAGPRPRSRPAWSRSAAGTVWVVQEQRVSRAVAEATELETCSPPPTLGCTRPT